MSTKRPTFLYERALKEKGFHRIVGVDEAGCGALAGPVVAGAVVLPIESRIGGIADSKRLSAFQRESLFVRICERAQAWSVGTSTVEEIMTIGIRKATYLAMQRAIEQIDHVEFALIDAWTLPDLSCPQQGIIRGDQHVKSIAAASIIAKVSRDRMMRELSKRYPNYGFEIHKGYGTKAHQQAIQKHGPCVIHRLTYRTFTK